MSLLARRFGTAIAEANAGIELNPSYPMLHLDLGWALAGLARYDEAVEALRQAATVAPDDPVPHGYLGWALGLAGKREEALAILGELEQRRNKQYVGGWLMAHVSLGLGDYEQTIVWLEKATEKHDGILPFLNTWYVFDPLRSDPRFQALLRRMNFPETAATGPATPSTP